MRTNSKFQKKSNLLVLCIDGTFWGHVLVEGSCPRQVYDRCEELKYVETIGRHFRWCHQCFLSNPQTMGPCLEPLFPLRLHEMRAAMAAMVCSGAASCRHAEGVLSTVVSLDPGVVKCYPTGMYFSNALCAISLPGLKLGNNNTGSLSISI